METMTSASEINPQADVDMLLGERVHTLMFRQHLSQTKMAPAVGVSQSVLSRKLRGEIEWSVADLMAAATALDVPSADLLPRLDSNQQPSGYPPEPASGPLGILIRGPWAAAA